MRDSEKGKNNLVGSLIAFQTVLKQSLPAASASYGLLSSILIFTYIGWYIDSIKNSSPMFTLVFLLIGLIIGFYLLAVAIKTIK